MEEKEFNYINVIPLVDVMLVLLTIVLTTSTFIASGMINVSLPKASAKSKEILKNQTISIHKDGTVYFNVSPMTLDELRETALRLDRETPMVIRADRDIRLQVFVDVLDIINNLGFRKVAIQTEKGGDRNQI
ncbi:MAG: biopolymer transporter ExbD [Nitrospirae bacterium CG_4_10_14_0_8_um_filter_41_23]|nr:biopolymer transporter ExbD [Nitrospirota bacterium]OIP59020.1 MAG: biopolymer transporter ExbD [Nitrospirae bacterium CG2_30_41_42]PIQ93777.1 MAG: biopolymer transporter ExbD [Nitrospirae bacterium CG11_big_fil_rev_8_21_14_0_20_41_14]PIV43480.1 MAG: biopolymer transporter ExbD [Nitrospirae bacterium CG02_land_8_20_14_3_00_41_53]PIY86357.1 MAG: biopolymer transporter ExbD [Nitrospirae bacterium CG_4_10_14_0_8_um_filter_41_23]